MNYIKVHRFTQPTVNEVVRSFSDDVTVTERHFSIYFHRNCNQMHFQVKELEEQLTKTELCLKGVAEASSRAQAEEREGLEREVRKRDKALEILR